MTRRKLLITIVVLLGIAGFLLSAIPLLSYFGPSATAGSTLTRLDIRKLQPGEYAYFDNQRQDYWHGKYLIIKDWNSSINVLLILKQQDEFVIPDEHWWRSGGWCKNLAPETKNGKIVPDGSIKCMDTGLPAWTNKAWRWSYSGKRKGEWVGDLHSPPYAIEDGEIVIGKTK